MSRFAYTIFCDDIRYEVNNKSSYMGILGTQMYLSAFPAVLPKLCAVITASTPTDRPFTSLKFKGNIGDTVLFDIDLDEDQVAKANQNQGAVEDPKGFMAQAAVTLSPLHLQEPGKLEITIIADGEKIECPGLNFGPTPEGMAIV